MFLSRLIRRAHRPSAGSIRSPRGYRPALQVLEDRTVPSGLPSGFGRGLLGGLFSNSGPATHLQVIVPENVQAGQTFGVLVEAEDASNRLASSYTGTVQISLGTTDSGATLPSNYMFTARDHGIHLFQVTLSATGSQTIMATDTSTSSISGSASTTVNPAPVATQFVVRVADHVTQGVPTAVTVVALDASGHVVPNYTGTVSLGSSDGGAKLPDNYQFTKSDNGRHTFQVTFENAGSQTVTATDTATSSVTGQASTTVDAVGAVTHFGVFTLGRAIAGFPTPVVVVALDASNHVVAGYTGTVHLTSGDGSATLPNDYNFQASDNGAHLFSVTFGTAGKQSITATDTSDGTITGTTNVRVSSASLFQNLLFGGLGH
jgi:hypothetical protein